jgi:hypothetical protein
MVNFIDIMIYFKFIDIMTNFKCIEIPFNDLNFKIFKFYHIFI